MWSLFHREVLYSVQDYGLNNAKDSAGNHGEAGSYKIANNKHID